MDILPQEFIETHGNDYPPERIAHDAYCDIKSLLDNRHSLGLTYSDVRDLRKALATLANIKEG